MARFEDSPGLFGSGVGGSTEANITCDWCGKAFTGREDENGESNAQGQNNPISYVLFGSKEICDCCFEQVERAVLENMRDILPWFIRITKAQISKATRNQELVKQVRAAMEGLLAEFPE